MLTNFQDPNPDTVFNRLFVRLIIGLVMIVAVLLTLTLQSGPRLRTVSLDHDLVTSQSGQRIALHANQPLAKIAKHQVRITPAADFSVASIADTITITLNQRLEYNTDYTITVSQVTAKDSSRRIATFKHSFTTADPALYYLKRSSAFSQRQAQPDKLYSTTLYSTQSEPVYSAPRILDYVVLDKFLVVATAENDEVSRLVLVNKATKQETPVELPEAGMVSQLHASGDGTTYGFAFTSQNSRRSDAYSDTLFMHNITPGHILVPVSGVAGKRVDVISWQFAPDRTTIVAQLLDTSLVLIDGNFKHQPVPLGQYSSINAFSRDGTKLVVSDGQGYGLLDLVKRSRQALPDGLEDTGSIALLDLRPGSNSDSYFAHTQIPVEGTLYREYIKYGPPGRARVLYDTATKGSSILEFGVSANDQIISVEAAQLRDAVYDGYPVAPKTLSTGTALIDAGNSKVVRDIDGIAVKWQQ
jgi:hypothetical protein